MRTFFNILGIVTQFAVVWHLWRTQLLKHFPFLAFHFTANGFWLVIYLSLSIHHPAYVKIWTILAVVTVCSLIAVFLETVTRSLEHYPGLSLRVVLGASGVIAVISGVFGALEPVYHFIRVLLVVQRVSGVAVAVCAIGLALVGNYLDPRRRANVIRHERIMASMAAVTALAAWLSNHGYPQGAINLLCGGSIVFPALWIWGLRRDGEEDKRPAANVIGQEQARAASNQLRGYYEE